MAKCSCTGVVRGRKGISIHRPDLRGPTDLWVENRRRGRKQSRLCERLDASIRNVNDRSLVQRVPLLGHDLLRKWRLAVTRRALGRLASPQPSSQLPPRDNCEK